jgi:hypothetical protein
VALSSALGNRLNHRFMGSTISLQRNTLADKLRVQNKANFAALHR